jgi:hypothetical protein
MHYAYLFVIALRMANMNATPNANCTGTKHMCFAKTEPRMYDTIVQNAAPKWKIIVAMPNA